MTRKKADIDTYATFVDKEVTDLSSSGTANCYIVSEAGTYKFKAVQGNSTTSVGDVNGVKVLWETFGTDVTPSVGDIIDGDVTCSDNYITFSTNSTFTEGNAVIAAYSDVDCTDGNVLWSWHIWCTDQPEEQVYYNNAGTLMDRNLGATAVIAEDVHSFGLLYQWGRKDPFLSGATNNSTTQASSTISWPEAEASSESIGTIQYAIAHPTTFISGNSTNHDWYYSNTTTTDHTRWKPQSEDKTIYDPCPDGWRVPDGGINGVWSTASESTGWIDFGKKIYYGVDFGSGNGMSREMQFGSNASIWYPYAGYISYTGNFAGAGYSKYGEYWASTPSVYDEYSNCMELNDDDDYDADIRRFHGYAQSIRCISESSATIVPVAGITIDNTSASLAVGNTLQLSATITPSNANVKTLLWRSNNTSVATVSETGIVTGVGAGECTITAKTHNGLSATCTITCIGTESLFVDMGLGSLWATKNLGASSETSYGTYYKRSDSKLSSAIDAIYGANSGFHVPTKAEFQQLIDNSTITETIKEGIKGKIFTSNINGNTIFFPAGGHYDDDHEKYIDVGSGYTYWTSTGLWVYEGGTSLYYDEDHDYTDCLGNIRIVGGKDLSKSESANSYIVSSIGCYKFKTVKGNSNSSVGTVNGVKVLWESTMSSSSTPNTGDIIKSNITYNNGYITFSTNDTFTEGNAVIAAYSDAECSDGNALWSWHIWCTDKPTDQVYNNNAGTMMDRNLGATSATPGDEAAIGLFYQWGRKDPFLCTSGYGKNFLKKTDDLFTSTIIWPEEVVSSASTGTIDYSIKNPTTFIAAPYSTSIANYDWYYTGTKDTDETRWAASKTIYDPCPAGYKIPKGGPDGVWYTAFGIGSPSYLTTEFVWDKTNIGYNFGTSNVCSLGSYSTIWYPVTEKWSPYQANYWSYSTYTQSVYTPSLVYGFDLYLEKCGVDDVAADNRGDLQLVRCVKE